MVKTEKRLQRETKDKEYNEFDWYFKSPNGETYEDVQQRCNKWLEEINTIQQQHIIVMSHGLLGRVLRGILLKLPYEKTIRLEVPQTVFFIVKESGLDYITNDYEFF